MSCYQLLSLNNNTGDLAITQGNTINLVQAIKSFAPVTPVQSFSIAGNVISLYYTGANGALQLSTVTLPTPTTGNTSISVSSTSSISANIASGVITSSVNISHASGNVLTLNSDGLFVPVVDTSVGVQSTSSLNLVNNSGTISGNVVISSQSGNSLTLTNTGLFVPPNSLNDSQVRALFSATAPILFDNTTGIISETQATTSINGWLSSTDWNTFNNKIAGGIGVGSSSSTPIFKGVDSSKNIQIRPVAAGAGVAISLVGDDIIIGTTATVPVVNAGTTQTIVQPTAAVTMAGISSVATGTIVANQWIQISGPAEAVFDNSSSLTANVSGLSAAGVYQFRLLAISSTGLTGVSSMTVTVSSGSITLDTIYWGAQVSGTPPNASQITSTGSSNSQNGANDVTVDYTSLTASTPLFCWFAIPNKGGTYFKTKYFMDALNHGNIGGSTDLFGAYTIVTISAQSYNVSITAYSTQFTETTLLQA